MTITSTYQQIQRSARCRRQSPAFGFQVLGFEVSGFGFGFRVSGFRSRVSGIEFRVSGFGSRVSGLEFGVRVRVSGFGFRVRVSGFRSRVDLRGLLLLLPLLPLLDGEHRAGTRLRILNSKDEVQDTDSGGGDHHVAGYQGLFGLILPDLPLPYPWEPSYVPTLLRSGLWIIHFRSIQETPLQSAVWDGSSRTTEGGGEELKN